MCNYWANFVKTGDPNGDDADGTPMEKWDAYTQDSPACMGFRDMPKAEIQHVSELEEFLIASQIK